MKLVIDFILVAGIIVNLIILLALFKIKILQLHHKLFISILLVLFLLLTTSYGIFHGIKWLQYLYILINGISYLLGPLIYLYVKSLAVAHTGFFKKNRKHIIPFAVYFALITIPLLISVVNKKYIFSYLEVLNENGYTANCVEILFGLFYLIISLRLFYKINTSLKDVFSTLEYKNIKWIEVLAIGLILFSCVQLVLITIEKLNGESEVLDFILAASYVTFVCYLGYFGLQQGQTVLPIQPKERIVSTVTPKEKRKYMTDEEINELTARITSIFPSQKPYLNEELTLGTLAIILETTDKKLSYYFNTHLQTNFYDFVNSQRVEAFKNKIAHNENENYTILGLAYDSGFRSKSSFNRIFKKETGVSPSDYIKSL